MNGTMEDINKPFEELHTTGIFEGLDNAEWDEFLIEEESIGTVSVVGEHDALRLFVDFSLDCILPDTEQEKVDYEPVNDAAVGADAIETVETKSSIVLTDLKAVHS